MNNPLVSIIITTYNRPVLLSHAIESVLKQTYENIQLIVVNDAGVNVSAQIDDWNDKYKKNILYIHKDINAGLGAARNTGLQYVRGKYVNFLDDDDEFYPHHVETLVRFLEKNNYNIAYSDAVYEVHEKNQFGQDNITHRVIQYSFDYQPDMLLYQNITPVNCVMFKWTNEIQHIKLDEKARVYEDWLYWLELTKYFSMNHIAVPTCKVRFVNDGSTMSSSRNEFTTMLPDIYKQNWQRAKNQVEVCNIMNQILQQRGLSPIFRIESRA